MTILILILALLVGTYLLTRGADMVIGSLTRISKHTGIAAYALAILISTTTSLPEMMVGVTSAVSGVSNLPLGVIVGSNIANISLIIGFACMVSGRIYARDEVVRSQVLVGFGLALLPLLMLLDKTLTRVDGLILLSVYCLYLISSLRSRTKEIESLKKGVYQEEQGISQKIIQFFSKKSVSSSFRAALVGSVIMIVSARAVVWLATELATELSLTVLFIGLFLVAVGTSLPELVFEIRTIAKRQYSMTLGNIIGSSVTNSCLVLGVVALLRPITIASSSLTYFTSVVAYILVAGLFWLSITSKKQLDRYEAAVLLGAYGLFFSVQLFLS